MKRFLIAFDLAGEDKRKVYLRETLCVTHDSNIGEVIYHAMPTRLTHHRIKMAIKLLKEALKEQTK